MLDLLGRQLHGIQAKLREIEIGIQVERSRVDGFVRVMGRQLGEVEANMAMRLAALETLINDRFDHLVDMIGLKSRPPRFYLRARLGQQI